MFCNPRMSTLNGQNLNSIFMNNKMSSIILCPTQKYNFYASIDFKIQWNESIVIILNQDN
jgi:hypothetical protein